MPRLKILRDRAAMFSAVRQFFAERHVLEVDCPILSRAASVDAHIDLISANTFDGLHYLHSSPEYGMKRLLSEGIGDIYQLSHVFRDGEAGYKHNPEFTMIEWYRNGFSFEQLIEETLDLIRIFLGPLKQEAITYRQAFLKYCHFDYIHSTPKDLVSYLEQQEIYIDASLDRNDKDALLNLILGTMIEPKLGLDKLTVLFYYPSSQAALARAFKREDEQVSERFEVYYKGVELANGYHELADASEQELRLEEANKERISLGKKALPIDYPFLEALKKGLPDCCGVAVGFDRLMMLRHQQENIAQVIPFDWKSS